MKRNTIEIEYLIREIEKMKRSDYECFYMNDGLDNPVILAQLSNRLLGEQASYDNLIHWLRKFQGCDGE